jgi:hypothetical protein
MDLKVKGVWNWLGVRICPTVVVVVVVVVTTNNNNNNNNPLPFLLLSQLQ